MTAVGSRSRAPREAGLTLLAGAAGAGIVLLAASRPWARASFAPSPPLPASHVTVTGHELVPAADALGLAALASLTAVLATRGAARRACGAILAALGAATAVACAAAVGHAHVAVTAAAHAPPAAAGAGAPQLMAVAFPWWLAGAAGGVLVAAAGVAAAWRGARWPGMSRRYERPAGRGGPVAAGDDQVTAWDALDRGADPTVPSPHPRS